MFQLFVLAYFVVVKQTIMTIKFLYLSVLLIAFSFSNAQTGNIKGNVKSADGRAVDFLTVTLKGTSKARNVNTKGEFEFSEINTGNYILSIQFLGLENMEQEVVVKENETTIVPEILLKETSKQLDEIVIVSEKSLNEKSVSVGKVDIKPMDLPQSVSTLNKDVLDQQQTTRMSDAVKNFNGVYLMGTSGGYQEELAGRGFAYGSSNTFKNGIRFNNTAMPEMSSLERLEVLKGSSAIVFGNVAAGGVINLVTKKPLFEKGGEVSFRTGSFDLYRPAVDVYGALNEKQTVAYRINTSFEKARSFRDQVKSERYYINPSFLIKLGKKTELLFEGDYLNDKRTADFGVGAINYELIDVPRDRFIGVSWSYFKVEQQSSTVSLTHRFNDKWQIKSTTSYQKFQSDLFANQRPNSNSQFVKANGNWVRGLQRTQVDEEYYISQLDLTGKFSTGKISHIFLVGIDADRYNTNTLAYNALTKYDSINVFDLNKYKQRNDIPELSQKTLTTSPISRAGVYVQDLISLHKKVKLLVGARWSYLETFSDVYTISTKATVKTRQFDNAVSPRFGLVYQPIKTMALFTSYSNSFTPNSGVDVDGKALPPSIFTQYEAGIKNDFFDGLLSANLTVYQIVNSNQAQTSLANGNTNANIKELAGEVTSKGIELDVMSKEWRGLTLIAGYSFNESRYTKSNTYIVGSLLRYNPNHTANGSINYNLSKTNIRWLKYFSSGVGVVYIGERMAGRSTRLTVVNDSYKLIPIPAYSNIEASVGYKKKNTAVRLKVSNVLNTESYNVHDDNSVNPIAPRQIIATFTQKF